MRPGMIKPRNRKKIVSLRGTVLFLLDVSIEALPLFLLRRLEAFLLFVLHEPVVEIVGKIPPSLPRIIVQVLCGSLVVKWQELWLRIMEQ